MNLRITYDDLVAYISSCGSDSLQVFRGVFEGGYHVQQIPEELAEAILIISRYRPQTYLEIGAAAGGTARIFWDIGLVKEIFIIDDNKHPKHWVRRYILPMATEWIGDSHSSECRQQLRLWNKQFDLILIDGDHSYEGVRSDLEMVLEFMAPWSLIALHDTSCLPGPRQLREDIRNGRYRRLKEIAHCGQELGLTIALYCDE